MPDTRLYVYVTHSQAQGIYEVNLNNCLVNGINVSWYGTSDEIRQVASEIVNQLDEALEIEREMEEEAEVRAGELFRLDHILHELKAFLRERDVELQMEVTSTYGEYDGSELLLVSSRDPHAYLIVPEKRDD